MSFAAHIHLVGRVFLRVKLLCHRVCMYSGLIEYMYVFFKILMKALPVYIGGKMYVWLVCDNGPVTTFSSLSSFVISIY